MAKEYSENITALKNKESAWDKTLPADARRDVILKAYRGNELAAAQALKTLANVTRDKEAKVLAATDAVFLLKMSQKYGKSQMVSQPYHDGQQPENV
jgi:hypothetical protein